MLLSTQALVVQRRELLELRREREGLEFAEAVPNLDRDLCLESDCGRLLQGVYAEELQQARHQAEELTTQALELEQVPCTMSGPLSACVEIIVVLGRNETISSTDRQQ